MARFDGKPVVKTSVSNGINKPEELIKESLTEKPRYITPTKVKSSLLMTTKRKAAGTSFISIS